MELVREGETLEGNNLSLFVSCSDVLSDRDLVVPNEVLLLESLLFEELLNTAIGDVLYHLCRKRSSLLLAYGLDDLTGLCSLLRGNPTLGGVRLDVILAVYVSGVDAYLLESGLYSLLNELFFGLLDSYSLLLLYNFLRASLFVNSNRIH